jgi:hypothetical protein
MRVHNRRKDVRPGTRHDAAQVVGILGRPDAVRSNAPYEQLEYTHRLITGWSWDRSDFKVILKDGRVVEFGHGEGGIHCFQQSTRSKSTSYRRHLIALCNRDVSQIESKVPNRCQQRM